jgi:hypothetical protein
MKSTPIEIIDNVNHGRRIDAFLIEDPDDDYVEATDKLWWVYRQRFLLKRAASNMPAPGHHHWSWKWKLQQESKRNSFYKCFGIIADNEPQGLMLLNYGREYLARLPEQAGQLLIYLAYVESAPWNLREYCEKPRFGAVGAVLFKAAIEFSNRLGFEGRIGLHALPRVENYYEKRCKMRKCYADQNYGGLVYFESTPEDSLAFLKEAKGR